MLDEGEERAIYMTTQAPTPPAPLAIGARGACILKLEFWLRLKAEKFDAMNWIFEVDEEIRCFGGSGRAYL